MGGKVYIMFRWARWRFVSNGGGRIMYGQLC